MVSRRPAVVKASQAHAATKEVAHEREGPSLLNYAAAIGEAFSSQLPPHLVALAYAVSITSVLSETAEKVQRSRAVWDEGLSGPSASGISAAHGADVIVSGPDSQSQRRVGGALAGRRALERGMLKMIGTVAIPSLIMHGITHCGWDALTDVSGTSDALQAAAGHVAAALHMPHDTVVAALGKGLPQVAGSFIIPLVARPVERLLDKLMDQSLRPAIDEFCSRGRSLSMAAGQSFSLAADCAATAGHSFVCNRLGSGASGNSFVGGRAGSFAA